MTGWKGVLPKFSIGLVAIGLLLGLYAVIQLYVDPLAGEIAVIYGLILLAASALIVLGVLLSLVAGHWKVALIELGSPVLLIAVFYLMGRREAIEETPISDARPGLILRLPDYTIPDIEAVAFSPDGATLAAGFSDMVRLWDLRQARAGPLLTDPAEPRPVPGAGWATAVRSIAFDASGSTFFVYAGDVLTMWDTRTWGIRERAEGTGGFALSRVGTYAIKPMIRVPRPGLPGGGNRGYTIDLRSVATGQRMGSVAYEGRLGDVSLSPDGRRLAVAGDNLELIPVASEGRRVILERGGDRDYLQWDVEFSPDGAWLALSSWPTTRFFDAGKGIPVREIEGGPAIAFTLDGKAVAVARRRPIGTQVGIEILQLTNGRLLTTLSGHGGSQAHAIRGIVFSPSGLVLASAGPAHGSAEAVRLWDVRRKQLIASMYMWEREWLIVTSQGYYDGSSGALQSVHEPRSGISPFGRKRNLHRPDLVANALKAYFPERQ